MKKLTLTLAAVALSTSSALAAGIADIDQNDDNFASFVEVAAAYPTLTRSDFNDLDLNDDRRLSNVELTAPGAQAVLNQHVTTAVTALDFDAVDADGDYFASYAELSAAVPGLTALDFGDIDSNGDNRVSASEYYAADAQTIVSRFEEGTSVVVSLSDLVENGAKFASFDDLSAAYPSLNALDFEDLDTNDDNRISSSELNAPEAFVILDRAL